MATGRFVWRGERRALVEGLGTEQERSARLRLFVEELLVYTSKLAGPDETEDPDES